jgi:hypothetical protein
MLQDVLSSASNAALEHSIMVGFEASATSLSPVEYMHTHSTQHAQHAQQAQHVPLFIWANTCPSSGWKLIRASLAPVLVPGLYLVDGVAGLIVVNTGEQQVNSAGAAGRVHQGLLELLKPLQVGDVHGVALDAHIRIDVSCTASAPRLQHHGIAKRLETFEAHSSRSFC